MKYLNSYDVELYTSVDINANTKSLMKKLRDTSISLMREKYGSGKTIRIVLDDGDDVNTEYVSI